DASVIALSDNLTSREWFSTQESNSLYLAGRFFINMAEQPWEVSADRDVPDALVVDLLPAGLEIENQNLASSSASLSDSAADL
ncbi:hypothetical protein, partial [Proteus terrae]|uniref:alpha-2-macroglobulin family protein n=1 Tax=Proteus terrae TaxID=1574161 RepID=UPI003315402B